MNSPGGYLYGPDEVEALNACPTIRPGVMAPMTTEEFDRLREHFAAACADTRGVPASLINLRNRTQA